jgi:methyltransferase
VHSGSALLAFVTLQRLVELALARRNTARLVARGAVEHGAKHYPLMVALHAAWLLSLWWFGWARDASLAFVIVYALLQVARVWVLATLGERWTTRILLLPGVAPIVSGPFRFVRHPNYAVVALELPCVSLALGLFWHALLFGVLNLAMLRHRIQAEDTAYADAV